MPYLAGGYGEIEMSYKDVRKMFDKTAVELGLNEKLAPLFGQSIWHLCNRGMDGISYAMTFLMLNKEELEEVWNNPAYPSGDQDLFAVCPFRTALFVDQQIQKARKDNQLEDLNLVVPKSAAPYLCLPFIVQSLKSADCSSKAIQISGQNATVTMSDAGLLETSESLAHEFKWVGDKSTAKAPMQISVLEDMNPEEGLFFPKVRHTSFWLPANRIMPNGALRLN